MRARVTRGGVVGLMLMVSLAPVSQAGTDDGEPVISLKRTKP